MKEDNQTKLQCQQNNMQAIAKCHKTKIGNINRKNKMTILHMPPVIVDVDFWSLRIQKVVIENYILKNQIVVLALNAADLHGKESCMTRANQLDEDMAKLNLDIENYTL